VSLSLSLSVFVSVSVSVSLLWSIVLCLWLCLCLCLCLCRCLCRYGVPALMPCCRAREQAAWQAGQGREADVPPYDDSCCGHADMRAVIKHAMHMRTYVLSSSMHERQRCTIRHTATRTDTSSRVL